MEFDDRRVTAEMILSMVRQHVDERYTVMIDAFFNLYYDGFDNFIKMVRKEKELWKRN